MTHAITVFKHRQTVIPMDWKDENGVAIDMTGYTLSGSIDWAGGTLDIDSSLAYTTILDGEFSLTISQVDGATLPDGVASNITIIATTGGNDYYLADNEPVYAVDKSA